MRTGVITQPKPPVAAASAAWRHAALHVRGRLRARGVQGALVGLDRIVQGTRGQATAAGIALFMHNLHAAGLTLEEIRDETHIALNGIADTTLDAMTKPAA